MKNTDTPQLKLNKDEINHHVQLLIDQGSGSHLEALHDMFSGYMKHLIYESRELELPTEEAESVSFTYEWLRDLLRTMVRAERELAAAKARMICK